MLMMQGGSGAGGMSSMLPMMMMMQGGSGSGGMSSMLPLMLMMQGGSGAGGMSSMLPLMLMMNDKCKETEGSGCAEKKSGGICGKDLSAADEAILAEPPAFGPGYKLKPCCKCK